MIGGMRWGYCRLGRAVEAGLVSLEDLEPIGVRSAWENSSRAMGKMRC